MNKWLSLQISHTGSDIAHGPMKIFAGPSTWLRPELQVAFRADSIDASNMKAIQAVNRVVLNSVFMANLLKGES